MLGQRIAALRRQKNMSQADLARKLKISPSAVGMYEQDRRTPSTELLVNMAGVFGVSTDFLLTGQPHSETDGETLTGVLLGRISASNSRFQHRPDRPFSRQELAVLFAAMLMEP